MEQRGDVQEREPLCGGLPLSSRLQQGYLERVRRLPEDTQLLLLLASADADLAAVLAAGARLQITEEALRPAEREGLVEVDERRVRFSHPLIRTAIYSEAPFRDRLEAHRLLAEVRGGSNRVWHLAAATTGHDEEVAAALERTTEDPQWGRGPGAVAAVLERSAWLTSDQAERSHRLMRAAWDAFNDGDLARAHQLLDQAAPLAAAPLVVADIAFIRGLLQFQTASIDTACTTLVGGAKQVGELDSGRAARMLAAAGRMAWLALDLPRLEEIKGAAMALPGPDGTLSGRLAFSMLAPVLGGEHHPPGDFVAAASESLDSLEPTLCSVDHAWWLWPPASPVATFGEDVAVYRLYTQAAARLRGAGLVRPLVQALISLSGCALSLGYWSSAQVHAAEGLRLAGDTQQTDMAGLCLSNLAPIAGAQGRDADCRRLAGEARSMLAVQGAEFAVAATEWGLGLLELGSRRYEEAYAHLSGIASPELWPEGILFAPVAVFDLLEAAVLTHREDIAWRVLRTVERLAELSSAPWAQLIIHRTRAMLATGMDAEAEFQAALATASSARFHVARTRLAYGEWLRRRGRKTEARSQIRAALEVFDELRARPWSKRARTGLRVAGETVPRRRPEAIDRLTTQELQVARLAAGGLSNQEIGAQLFLGPRTAGLHLSNVYRKLGIAPQAVCLEEAAGERLSRLTRALECDRTRDPTCGESTGLPIRNQVDPATTVPLHQPSRGCVGR